MAQKQAVDAGNGKAPGRRSGAALARVLGVSEAKQVAEHD